MIRKFNQNGFVILQSVNFKHIKNDIENISFISFFLSRIGIFLTIKSGIEREKN